MGTGSYGGGGSGSGGSGSGRYGGWGGGKWKGYIFKNKKLVVLKLNKKNVRIKIKSKLRQITNQYLDNQFCSKLTNGAYQELFTVASIVYRANSSIELAKQYNIEPGSGFIRQLVNAIVEKYRLLENNLKVQETIRTSLEDFFIKALGDNLTAIDLYINGTSSQILAKLDKSIFKHTSGFFLSKLLWRIIEREIERQPEEIQSLYSEISEEIANKIITSFEDVFIPKGKMHRDLFNVIQDDPEWFRRELRK